MKGIIHRILHYITLYIYLVLSIFFIKIYHSFKNNWLSIFFVIALSPFYYIYAFYLLCEYIFMSEKFIYFYSFIYKYCVGDVPFKINNYNILFALLYNLIKELIKKFKEFYIFLIFYMNNKKKELLSRYKNSKIIFNFKNNLKIKILNYIDLYFFKINKTLKKYILTKLEIWYIYSKTKKDISLMYMALDWYFDRKKRNIMGFYFGNINKGVLFFYKKKIYSIHGFFYKIFKYIITCPKILKNKYSLRFRQFKDKIKKILKKYV